MSYRTFPLRLILFCATLAPFSVASAHHGPPHGEEDEFLLPPAAVSSQPAFERLVQAWPAFLLPAATLFVLVAGSAGNPLRKPTH